jgi:hypothetical protein
MNKNFMNLILSSAGILSIVYLFPVTKGGPTFRFPEITNYIPLIMLFLIVILVMIITSTSYRQSKKSGKK